MSTITLKSIDTFCDVPYSGNPAGVILDAGQLTSEQMQSIAREVNLPEIAYVLPPTQPGVDVKIRWFTPQREIKLPGHAMIAVFHALAEEKQLGIAGTGERHLSFEDASGIHPADIGTFDGRQRITVGLNVPAVESATQYRVDAVRFLKITVGDFEPSVSIQRSGFLFVPIRRLHTVFTLQPNFPAMANFLLTRKMNGVCVYTMETVDRGSLVHARVFAPHHGIFEDPATGSAHGVITAYLFRKGQLPLENNRCSFTAEQGDEINRKSRLHVDVAADASGIQSLRIGGGAVTILTGEIQIPA